VRDALERLFRHSIVFLIGLLFQRAARVLLLPLYWSAFPPAQFGLLDLLEVFIQVMVLTFSFALPTAYVKFHRIDVAEGVAPDVLRGTTLALSVIGIVLLALAMAVFQTPLSWLFFDGRYPRLYAIASAAIVANIAFLLVQSALRARGRAGTFVILSTIQFVLLMALNIYFVKSRGMGLEGVIWSAALACAFPALIYALFGTRGARGRFDLAIARRLLRFALPLVPFSLVAFLLMISARLFLQHFHGAEVVGIFSAANRVALILLLVCVTPFQTAWGYLGLDYLRRADAGELFSRTFTYLLAWSLWGFLAISAVGREFILRFGASHYLPSLPYVDFLMAGYVMQLFFYWANIALVGREMTVRILLISLLPFAISIGGGWLAIPRYGLGAACGVLFTAMAIHALLTAIFAGRIIHFSLEKPRVAKALLAFALAYGFAWGLRSGLPQWRLVISLGPVAAFPLLLLALGFLTRGETVRLQELRRYVMPWAR